MALGHGTYSYEIWVRTYHLMASSIRQHHHIELSGGAVLAHEAEVLMVTSNIAHRLDGVSSCHNPILLILTYFQFYSSQHSADTLSTIAGPESGVPALRFAHRRHSESRLQHKQRHPWRTRHLLSSNKGLYISRMER